MELSQENVGKIFMDCLCKRQEDAITITYHDANYFLDKNLVSINIDVIEKLIRQIQTYERTNKNTKTGNHLVIVDMRKDNNDTYWTKKEVSMRQLIILGLAANVLIPCEDMRCEHYYLKK